MVLTLVRFLNWPRAGLLLGGVAAGLRNHWLWLGWEGGWPAQVTPSVRSMKSNIIGCSAELRWAMSPRTYVKEAIATVEDLLIEDGEGKVLKSNVSYPFPNDYKPEVWMYQRSLDHNYYLVI